MNTGLRVLALPGAEAAADGIARALGVERCQLAHRRFPDGETYLRVLDNVAGCAVAVVASLRDPDPQLAALLFLPDALREQGAVSVGLVAPYLPYMRQDTRFQPGEAVTSASFARLVSQRYDGLVTVDPHLHRHATLGEIYAVPTTAVASAPAIAAWVREHVQSPCLVGPDEESTQWVSQVARRVGCPGVVLTKHRRGDFAVALTLPDLAPLAGRTPVLLDDIISSARTLAEAVKALRARGLPAPFCIGVHAVFAGDAQACLDAAGAGRVLSCNTVPHASNAIDLAPWIAQALAAQWPAWRRAV